MHRSKQVSPSGSSITRRTLLTGVGIAAGSSILGAGGWSPAAAATGWGGYSNGQIPLSAMTQVAGFYFRTDAGRALAAMRDAYATALGRSLSVIDGYRDLAGQWAAWHDYLKGGALAAYPGTSNHGWGIAVDFGGEVFTSSASAGHRWLQANARRFNWWWAGRDFSQVENWHWEFDGIYTPTDPTTPTDEDEDMSIQLWLYTPTNSLLLVDHLNMTYRNLGNVNTVERAVFDGKPYRVIGEPAWTQNFGRFKGISSPA